MANRSTVSVTSSLKSVRDITTPTAGPDFTNEEPLVTTLTTSSRHLLDNNTNAAEPVAGGIDRGVLLQQTLGESEAGVIWTMNTIKNLYGQDKPITSLMEFLLTISSTAHANVTITGTLLQRLFTSASAITLNLTPGDFVGISYLGGLAVTTETLQVSSDAWIDPGDGTVKPDPFEVMYECILMGT